MVCLLAIPCLYVGIGYVCGEHGIEEQVVNRLIAEVQSSVDGIDRLVRGTVVILIHDIIVVEFVSTVSLIEMITAVCLVSRDGTTCRIGVIDQIDFSCSILPVIHIAVHIELQLDLLAQIIVYLSHCRISAVGRVVHHVILVRVTDGRVIPHHL